MQPNNGPLKGVRVLELGALIAGPYASALLAQFGAEVIKVEPPGEGDPLRKWRKMHEGTSLWWYSQSRNKKSLTLDLKHAKAQEIVRKLVQSTDILIENFRPGTLEKWGLGWDALRAINPKLVMVRISGYGQTGPYKDRPGFAAIAECMGGLRHVTGFPDLPPVRAGVSLGDTLASLYGTIGALLAMHHVRSNQGQGQLIDVALYESVFAVMESLIPEYVAQGHVRGRSGSSLPGIAPSNTYRCQDGQFVVIAGNGDGIFKRLMKALGRQDLAEDPSLAHNDGRVKQVEMLDQVISDWTAGLSLDTALAILQAADVPCGRVYTAADIVQDPQYAARDMIERHRLPDGLDLALPAVVPKLSNTPGQTNWVGPALGAHTREVLSGLGLEAEEIEQLRKDQVI
jgi:crotonobetainyl-CoA:carnitine CoA-transferase CaiB-like acyl-CoA transferase